VCVCFFSFDFLVQDYLFLLFSLVCLTLLSWSFPSNTPWIELLDLWIELLFFFKSWNVLFSPFILIKSFSRYSILGWHLWSLRGCSSSF
jgi:hypothetical protein